MKFFIKNLCLLLALAFIAGSCSSTKKRSEVSALGKFWHDTNARFNGYYNANLLMDETIAALDAQHVDNYTQVLPVYPHVFAQNPQGQAPSLDLIIEKATTNITLHEPSNWTDDNYLLIGQSQYLKQDYETAEQTLEYAMKHYSPEALAKMYNERKGKKTKKKKKRKKRKKSKKKKPKKRKKISSKEFKKRKAKEEAEKARKKLEQQQDKNKPPADTKEVTAYDYMGSNGGSIKHKPAYQHILLWLARTYIERDNFSGADYYFRLLEANPFLMHEVASQVPAARAHLYLDRKEYQAAAPYLQAAVEHAPNRSTKGRYAYILGQVLERTGQMSEAALAYERAGKFSNQYIMEFHAKLKQVELAWKNNHTDDQTTLRILERMVKDDKNIEYTGEIYFTMAKIATAMGDTPLAMLYYREALSSDANTNPVIKAEIYHELAAFFFDKQDYVQAKAYYDSTLMVMPEQDERFLTVQSRSQNLNEIAELMSFIERQDSLLQIANMSEKDRNKLANQLKREREEEQAAVQTDNDFPSDKFGTGSQQSAIKNNSQWPFYYRKQVDRGIREFQNRWGDRPLEDNWRRSTRNDVSIVDNNIDLSEDSQDQIVQVDYGDLFADVPFEADQQAQVTAELDSAVFILGTLLRDKLQNYPMSIRTLENHLHRFPDSKRRIRTHYYLYLAHGNNGNTTKSRFHADEVCRIDAQSVYCRIIKDPESVAAEIDSRKQAQLFYEQTYELFQDRKYEEVISMVQQVPEKFGDETDLKPKFALLNAMSKGHMGGKDVYIKSLRDVIGAFNGTPEATRAKEIIRLLDSSFEEPATTKPNSAAQTLNSVVQLSDKFEQKDNDQHYALLILKSNQLVDQDARLALSDYHDQFHKLSKLKISSMALRNKEVGNDKRMLVIRRFKNQAEAHRYFDGFIQNIAPFLPDADAWELLYVSRTNYRIILMDQRIDQYRQFFEETYR